MMRKSRMPDTHQRLSDAIGFRSQQHEQAIRSRVLIDNSIRLSHSVVSCIQKAGHPSRNCLAKRYLSILIYFDLLTCYSNICAIEPWSSLSDHPLSLSLSIAFCPGQCPVSGVSIPRRSPRNTIVVYAGGRQPLSYLVSRTKDSLRSDTSFITPANTAWLTCGISPLAASPFSSSR